NGDFSQVNTCGSSVAARSSCSVLVVFSPTGPGNRAGLLIFTDNASPGTQKLSLSGNGVSPVVVSPIAKDFSTVAVGGVSTAKTFTLTNSSAATITLSSISSGSGFAQTNTCNGSLAVRASCTISVTFAPSVVGPQIGSLNIGYNGIGSPAVATLTG